MGDRVLPKLRLGDQGLFIAGTHEQIDRLFHYFVENGIVCGSFPDRGQNILQFQAPRDVSRIEELFAQWLRQNYDETVEYPLLDEGK